MTEERTQIAGKVEWLEEEPKMSIGRIIAWFFVGVAFSGMVFLWGYNVGLDTQETKVLETKERSVKDLANCNNEIKRTREEVDDFKYEICKQLGLIER